MTLEEKLNILAVNEAIGMFEAKFPNSDWNKLQIEPEGPYIKYEMVGVEDEFTNTLEINAHTGGVLKERQKPHGRKGLDPVKRERRALNMAGLLPLTEINDIAQAKIADAEPFQWELDRQKERTVWKIEFANQLGTDITEFKVDAHDGTIVQMKMKN
ncbi:PepSY domain-containing protein [Aerococcaceae bacterium DSM 111022]|nr:PepSY domain-containing protein [Aerococcaceae bacterium DSM 111022]MBG9988008.1 PepSY domain-containing protein [Aerococcaceae bacterium DSM 111176]